MTAFALPFAFAPPFRGTLTGSQDEVAGLVREASAGSPEALARLYDAMGPELFAFAAWRSGQHALAEDAVQELFCRLAQGRLRIPEPLCAARAWLFACVRNALIDGARKTVRRSEDGGEALLQLVGPALPVEDLALLSRALGRLPAKARETIYLHVYQGMTFREIGRLVGVPTFTAASRYRLAIRRLEKAWGVPR